MSLETTQKQKIEENPLHHVSNEELLKISNQIIENTKTENLGENIKNEIREKFKMSNLSQDKINMVIENFRHNLSPDIQKVFDGEGSKEVGEELIKKQYITAVASTLTDKEIKFIQDSNDFGGEIYPGLNDALNFILNLGVIDTKYWQSKNKFSKDYLDTVTADENIFEEISAN